VDFLTRNWGNLASVVGLVVSAVSAVFAKRAATAAREARQSVLAHSLGEDIHAAEKLAREITSLADLGKFELSVLRCNDLHDHTVVILNRWNGNLTSTTKNNCLAARSLLDSVREVVSKAATKNADLTAAQTVRIRDACRQVKDIFIAERASVMKKNDEENDA
jgi:hypothetical protein